MLEVELKASLAGVDAAALRQTVETRCGAPRANLREQDLYFNGNDRDFRKTDEALRLRRVLDGGTGRETQTLLTYKGAKQDALSSTRLEYETAVSDGEVMLNLLRSLGYTPVFVVDKRRREYAQGDITLCLDTVEGLGAYLELELLCEREDAREAAVQRLLETLGDLGVPKENLTRKSYLELLMKKN